MPPDNNMKSFAQTKHVANDNIINSGKPGFLMHKSGQFVIVEVGAIKTDNKWNMFVVIKSSHRNFDLYVFPTSIEADEKMIAFISDVWNVAARYCLFIYLNGGTPEENFFTGWQ